jgi:hypothetical protein
MQYYPIAHLRKCSYNCFQKSTCAKFFKTFDQKSQILNYSSRFTGTYPTFDPACKFRRYKNHH